MDMISLKLDEGILKQIDEIVKKHNYGTRIEFIMACIREKMTQLEKDGVVKPSMDRKGSIKKSTSDDELRRIREEVSAEYIKKHKLV
jgi:metal-responsive CopG/Arc/MetJ family transcriptional regulator